MEQAARCRLSVTQQHHYISAELHYTDTGYEYEHHQQTSSQQFCNLLYNKFTTNGQKFATSQHLHMSRCWALALQCGKFVVELLWARPLVVLYKMSVAGVRVVETGVWPLVFWLTGWQIWGDLFSSDLSENESGMNRRWMTGTRWWDPSTYAACIVHSVHRQTPLQTIMFSCPSAKPTPSHSQLSIQLWKRSAV